VSIKNASRYRMIQEPLSDDAGSREGPHGHASRSRWVCVGAGEGERRWRRVRASAWAEGAEESGAGWEGEEGRRGGWGGFGSGRACRGGRGERARVNGALQGVPVGIVIRIPDKRRDAEGEKKEGGGGEGAGKRTHRATGQTGKDFRVRVRV